MSDLSLSANPEWYGGTWKYNSNTYEGRYLQLRINQTEYNNVTNESTLAWELRAIGGGNEPHSVAPTTVRIYGADRYKKGFTSINDGAPPAIIGTVERGTITVKHNDDGTKKVWVSFTTKVGVYETAQPVEYAGEWITLTPIPQYKLSIDQGIHSRVEVTRTSSVREGAAIGKLSNSDVLYYGDALRIKFGTEEDGYELDIHTINGDTAAVDSTITVQENINIVSSVVLTFVTATISGTPISPVEPTSSIYIGRTVYFSMDIPEETPGVPYKYNLIYNFEGAIGIIARGTSDTSLTWEMPSALASQIPNSQSGICEFAVETISATGSSEYIIYYEKTAYITSSDFRPIITPTSEDTRIETLAITNNDQDVIAGQSTVKYTVVATPKYGATISNIKLDGADIDSSSWEIDEGTGEVTASTTRSAVNTNEYTFEVADSRGLLSTATIKRGRLIPYSPITFRHRLERDTPSSDTINLWFEGSAQKSIGGWSNSIGMTCRYKRVGESSWTEFSLNSSTGNGHIAFPADGTANSNKFWSVGRGSNTTIVIPNDVFPGDTTHEDDLNHKYAYKFEIRVHDALTSVLVSNIDVKKGIPIFDWGENDFNFNVPVSVHQEISFDNKQAQDQCTIYFTNGIPKGSNVNSGDPYPHNCMIYGGDPETATGIGMWDGHNSRRIMSYEDDSNVIYLGDVQKTASGSTDVVRDSQVVCNKLPMTIKAIDGSGVTLARMRDVFNKLPEGTPFFCEAWAGWRYTCIGYKYKRDPTTNTVQHGSMLWLGPDGTMYIYSRTYGNDSYKQLNI